MIFFSYCLLQPSLPAFPSMADIRRWFSEKRAKNELKDSFSKQGKSVTTEIMTKVKGSGLISVRIKSNGLLR